MSHATRLVSSPQHLLYHSLRLHLQCVPCEYGLRNALHYSPDCARDRGHFRCDIRTSQKEQGALRRFPCEVADAGGTERRGLLLAPPWDELEVFQPTIHRGCEFGGMRGLARFRAISAIAHQPERIATLLAATKAFLRLHQFTSPAARATQRSHLSVPFSQHPRPQNRCRENKEITFGSFS